jgi:hypothetical protein
MRHLLLIAVFAAPVAFADGANVRPEDPEAPPAPVAVTPLPPPFEPVLRAEGAQALQRSDIAASPAPAPHGMHHHDHHGSRQ